MSQTPQQLDSRSSTEKLKHFQSELDVQLKLCKRIVEEGTKTSRIGAEQIRHVDDFIKTFRMLRTVTLEEICRTVPEIEDYDRSTLSQMLQTRKDISISRRNIRNYQAAKIAVWLQGCQEGDVAQNQRSDIQLMIAKSYQARLGVLTGTVERTAT
nr:unnamed protein product [Haemonchus contortus]